MADLRTEITEVATALGMTGIASLDLALRVRPALIRNVAPDQWDRLGSARADGKYPTEFEAAWDNGRAFLLSRDGLRGRRPVLIEWKGSDRPPGFDLIPADLRVDHVYLVSCKYQSRILSNSSPTNLFDRRLADRSEGRDVRSWYASSSPAAYERFYERVRAHLGEDQLPATVEELDPEGIALIRSVCGRRWPEPLLPHWTELSASVAAASADRWSAQLSTRARQEEMLWRLLRLSPAPYFVLGAARDGSQMRLRIGTPWDWRQKFRLRELSVAPRAEGQPVVAWSALVTRLDDGADTTVNGHVEIRWAHGRFSSVEAKIYLDTPHSQVCGYFPLA